MKQVQVPTLEQQIRRLRSEIEALIDSRAEAVAEGSPGVPVGVIRSLLTARAPACSCAQYLELFVGSEEKFGESVVSAKIR